MENLIFGILVVNIVALVATRMRKKPAVTADGISVDAAQAAISRSKGERFELFARFLRGRKGVSPVERDLVSANLLIKPSEFFAANLLFLALMMLVAVLILAFWFVNDGAFFTLVRRIAFFAFMCWLGWKGPQQILAFLANKRKSTLEYQLADALTIISSSLKGGYSFVQGLGMAGEQMEEPIKSEITRCMRLIQLGLDTPRALAQMSERINSYDYDMTISATNIQLAVGGNLSQLLEGISNTIRDRIRLRREISALTAQGRISGAILFCLPIGIAFFLCGINWDYMKELFTPTGMNLIYLAMGMQTSGFFWIKKLLDFDN